MRKIMCLILFLTSLNSLFSVTVNGYAYLEGETDHSGIEVFFQRVAPDTLYRYTVYTDASGYYMQTVEQGIYDIKYGKLKYEKVTSNGVSLYSDYTISDLTLTFTNEIFGSISGTLERGIYPVSETLTIDLGDTLVIDPGVTLEFYTDAEFMINGLVIAQGADGDSIRFKSRSGDTWMGMVFADNSNDNSVFDKCVVENVSADGIYSDRCPVKISNSSFRGNNCAISFISSTENTLEITGCEFINNTSAVDYSSIIFTRYSGANLFVDNCIFMNNNTYRSVILASQAGENFIRNSLFKDNTVHVDGVISINYGFLCEVDSCLIEGNNISTGTGAIYKIGSGNLNVKNTTIKGNSCYQNGAVYNQDGEINISNCFIQNNITTYTSGGDGGGLKLFLGKALIENSVISGNSATKGAGISNNCITKLINCVISDNIGHGIYTSQIMDINNCILTGNTNYAVYNISATNVQNITYNDLYFNSPSNFYQCNEYLCVDVTTNSNGDPCDAYGNISLDPKFIDAANGDFRLQPDSPCIDAGTNTIAGFIFPVADIEGNYRIYDGDGNGSSLVDMGAYEYGSYSVGIVEQSAEISDFELYQNYPNPFNPVTTISYALPQASLVELNVYNLNGQLVQSLVNGKMDKGMHKAEFNGNDLTSGMYNYSLKVDNKAVSSKKMMMLK